MQRCISATNGQCGVHKYSTTSGATSCASFKEVFRPSSSGLRFHTAFHHGSWKLLQLFLDNHWNGQYCSAHSTWLLQYVRVLHYLATNHRLPLSSDVRSLPRWLRRQLRFMRCMRIRHRRKCPVGDRTILVTQASLLRQLPRWKLTGKMQRIADRVGQAQRSRRLLQIDRPTMVKEDLLSTFLRSDEGIVMDLEALTCPRAYLAYAVFIDGPWSIFFGVPEANHSSKHKLPAFLFQRPSRQRAFLIASIFIDR